MQLLDYANPISRSELPTRVLSEILFKVVNGYVY